MNIRKRLILSFLALVIIPSTIFLKLSYKNVSDVLLNQISEAQINFVESNSKIVERVFLDMTQILINISFNSDVKKLMKNSIDNVDSNSTNCNYTQINLIRNIINSIQLLTITSPFNVTIIPIEGRCFSNSENFTNAAEDIRNSEEFKKVIDYKTNSILWLDKTSSSLSQKKNVFSALIPVKAYDTSLENLGAVYVEISDVYINYLINIPSQGNDVVLISEDFNLLSIQDKDSLGNDILPVKFDDILIKKTAGWYKARVGNKDTMIAYSSPLIGKWRLATLTQYNKIFNKMDETRSKVFIIGGALVCLFIAIALTLSYLMSKPMVVLSEQMKRVENGDLDLRVEVTGNDEVGVFQRNFNSMLEKIHFFMGEIKLKEIQKREAEMNALQAQINPHFLFNTLSSIRWAAALKEDSVEDMVLSLISLLKMSIKKGTDKITLNEECTMLEHYIKLHNLRSKNKITFELKINDDLSSFQIPRFILQPLVENSIKHGFNTKNYLGYIQICAFREVNCVVIQVIDNGCGFPNDFDVCNIISKNASNESDFSSIGLNNVRERILLHYNAKSQFKVYNKYEAQKVIGAVVEIYIYD